MKKLRMIGVVLLVAAVPMAVLSAVNAPEKAHCVTSKPKFNSEGPGYEILDMVRGEAWATRDWTPTTFEAFALPLDWTLWFKNGPRVAVADRATFSKSPGCANDGEFSYMRAFGRTFVLAARPHTIISDAAEGGLIRGAQVEKYHRLVFSAGRIIEVLKDPAGQAFIAVSSPQDLATLEPELPAGWSLEGRLLTEDLGVDLVGDVTVLRLANGMSYQGPIALGD